MTIMALLLFLLVCAPRTAKTQMLVRRQMNVSNNGGVNDSDKDKECRCPIIRAAFAPQTIY